MTIKNHNKKVLQCLENLGKKYKSFYFIFKMISSEKRIRSLGKIFFVKKPKNRKFGTLLLFFFNSFVAAFASSADAFAFTPTAAFV